MSIAAIKAEIDADPLARGYAGMTDKQVAESLNDTVDRTRNKTSMTGDELFAATDSAEFAALTDHKESLWVSFCGRDSIDPFGASNVAFVQHIFGTGPTLTALQNLRVESVSRATELGLGRVREGDVIQARQA